MPVAFTCKVKGEGYKEVYSMNNKALYPGTFDPFTNGHHDILNRALKLFDEVTLLVAVSPIKNPLLSLEQRLSLLTKMFAQNKKIKIDSWSGLTVDYAKKYEIAAIVRGLRPTGDFEMEFQMASMNRKLYSGAETVFLMTGANQYFISSSLVREIFSHGGDISQFVPEEIFRGIRETQCK